VYESFAAQTRGGWIPVTSTGMREVGWSLPYAPRPSAVDCCKVMAERIGVAMGKPPRHALPPVDERYAQRPVLRGQAADFDMACSTTVSTIMLVPAVVCV